MILGRRTQGATTLVLEGDSAVAARFGLDRDARAPKLSVLVSGAGAGAGEQAVRGVAYDDGYALLGSTAEHLVAAGDPPAWVDLAFPEPGGLALPEGEVLLGVHGGLPTAGDDVVALYVDEPGGAGARVRTGAAFTAGAPDPLGGTDQVHDLSAFATLAETWTAPELPDLELARHPFAEAQRLLAAGTRRGERRRARVGWHGTRTDPERGSFCIVRSEGPLGDLVGERLRFRRGRDSVIAYCHRSSDEYDELEDVTLTRRLYLALAPLAAEEVRARIEVLV